MYRFILDFYPMFDLHSCFQLKATFLQHYKEKVRFSEKSDMQRKELDRQGCLGILILGKVSQDSVF